MIKLFRMKSWKKNFTLAGMGECWIGRRLLEKIIGKMKGKSVKEF